MALLLTWEQFFDRGAVESMRDVAIRPTHVSALADGYGPYLTRDEEGFSDL